MEVKILTTNLYRETFIDFDYHETKFSFTQVRDVQSINRVKKFNENKCIVLMRYIDFCKISSKNRLLLKSTNKKIIVYDFFPEAQEIVHSFRLGADGCIMDSVGLPEFYSALYTVSNGKIALDHSVSFKLINSLRVKLDNPLTVREQEVLFELSKGNSHQLIGKLLAISIDTVRTHIKHIYDKLQVRNRDQALEKARLSNLI